MRAPASSRDSDARAMWKSSSRRELSEIVYWTFGAAIPDESVAVPERVTRLASSGRSSLNSPQLAPRPRWERTYEPYSSGAPRGGECRDGQS